MPEIMLRRNERGDLLCYIPKKDLEAVVRKVEFDQDDCWGGTLSLANGEKLYMEPRATRPHLPMALRVLKL